MQIVIESMTFEQLETLLISEGVKCCDCGTPLEHGDMTAYDHENGYKLKDSESRQWVFFHCPECGYDMSLAKALSKLEIADLK